MKEKNRKKKFNWLVVGLLRRTNVGTLPEFEATESGGAPNNPSWPKKEKNPITAFSTQVAHILLWNRSHYQ